MFGTSTLKMPTFTITLPMAMEIARRPRTARKLGYVSSSIPIPTIVEPPPPPEPYTLVDMEADRRPRAARKFVRTTR